ncbi:hypothetical protein GYA25_02590 [Candidatus Woesearchaeota archaeon]|nr:hypothetical protein [Candidatus Woesearchaeota archaeon]
MKKSKNKSVKKSSNSKNLSPKSKVSNKKENKKEVKNKIQKDNSKLKTFFNKNKPFIIGSIIFLVLLLILLAVQFNSTGKVITGYDPVVPSDYVLPEKGVTVGVIKVGDTPLNADELAKDHNAIAMYDGKFVLNIIPNENGLNNAFSTILFILLGKPVYFDLSKNSFQASVSSLIIVFCIWLMIFISFSDIISLFYVHKSKLLPWILGLSLSTILAQMGFFSALVVGLTGLLGSFGALSIYLSLGAAFLAFLGANGIILPKFKDFVLKRKIMEDDRNARMLQQEAAAATKNLAGYEERLVDAGSRYWD